MSDEHVLSAAPKELGPRAEEMVTWWMIQYGLLTDDTKLQEGNRASAVGSLVTFLKGMGQPPLALFLAFPEMAEKYYSALGRMVPPVPPMSEPAPAAPEAEN